MTQLDENAAGIVDVVQRDHREIEQMFAKVEGATGKSRQQAFNALAQKLKAHEAAEQEVVHPITDEVGATDVADSVEKEESTASQLLASMEDMDTASDEFEAKFEELKSDVLAHAGTRSRRNILASWRANRPSTCASSARSCESAETPVGQASRPFTPLRRTRRARRRRRATYVVGEVGVGR